MGRFVMGIIVGIALTIGAQRYHVLNTDQGIQFVPKLVQGFGETYLDVREFTLDDWSRHKSVAAAVVHAGKESILRDGASETLVDGMDDVLRDLGLRSAGRVDERPRSRRY